MQGTEFPAIRQSLATSGTIHSLPTIQHELTNDLRGMSRDERIYSDAEAFQPVRFIVAPGKDEPIDPKSYVFGFGRRYVLSCEANLEAT